MIGTRTIAPHYDPALCRTVASARGEDLLAQVPQLQLARIEVDDFATVPNLDMTVEVAAGKSGPPQCNSERRQQRAGESRSARLLTVLEREIDGG
jgi:hypothetical protein